MEPLTLPDTEKQEETLKYERGQKIFRRAFLTFFVLFLLGTAYWVGFERGAGTNTENKAPSDILAPGDAIILNKINKEKSIDFELFWKVWDLLIDKYVDGEKLDAHTLFYGAIKGMLAATGDPYTTFFDPEENKSFQEDISGTFEGIGAEMGVKNDIITIIAPLEGMPAEKAGIMAGDKLVKINDESTATMTLEEAVGKIRGAKGTEVTMTLFRNGEEEYRTITVKRDTILVKSVRFEMKENAIAYIRINRFGDDTKREFQSAVKQTLASKPKGLIIDLRNNPGGFLETSVDIASLMIPKDSVVVIEEDGAGKREMLKARGGDVLSGTKTVVLINEGSASASEILAGALKDNRDNITLVGKKSYGKGSVQELIPIDKETSVKITVARWLTPAGEQINNVGIAPDIEVGLTADDVNNKRDPQLDKALDILKEQ